MPLYSSTQPYVASVATARRCGAPHRTPPRIRSGGGEKGPTPRVRDMADNASVASGGTAATAATAETSGGSAKPVSDTTMHMLKDRAIAATELHGEVCCARRSVCYVCFTARSIDPTTRCARRHPAPKHCVVTREWASHTCGVITTVGRRVANDRLTACGGATLGRPPPRPLLPPASFSPPPPPRRVGRRSLARRSRETPVTSP